MIDSRSSFGCTIDAAKYDIYVVGGYTSGEITRKCEKYSINNNTWSKLPDITEIKCSTSLCVLDSKALYSFGGLSKVGTNI